MFWRRRSGSDFRAEIEAHVQLEAERLKQEGLSDDDAQHAARRAFGNVTQAQERFYESRRGILSDTLRDVRFGLRMLARNPGLTVVAVLTLALGIGANTAIFSLLNAVLLRDLPVARPHELFLFGKGEWVGSQDTLPDRSWQLFSYPFFREFRAKNQVFSDVAAIDSITFRSHGSIGGDAGTEKIAVELVSGSFFKTVGVNALLGRVLTDADDRKPGAHPVAVASYAWWQRRFGRNPRIVGQTVTINSTVYNVVGVTPPEFFGVTVGQSPDVWIPLAMEKEISPGWNGLERDLFQSLYIIARRKPDVTLAEASSNTNLLFKQILYEYAGSKPSPKDVEDIQHALIELTPASKGLSQLRFKFESPLVVLMALVFLILLIACANVANLLLARATSRGREIAVRMSIGADRSRLVRQLFVENGLLGTIGAVMGTFVAWLASDVLVAAISPGSRPTIQVAPDLQVLAFTAGISILTVLLFGVAPAFHATRLKPASSLKDGRGAIGSASHGRLSRGLIVVQVALSLMLLLGAVLFLRSLVNLLHVDTGFDKQNVLLAGIDPGSVGYRVDARLATMMDQVEQRLRSVPGIRGASFVFSTFGGGWTDPVVVPGRPVSDHDPDVFQNIVGPDYFATMKIPVVLGRSLSPADTLASRKVAVITETMARIYFAGASPLGRTFSIPPNREWQNIEVVGVARDAKFMSLRQNPMPVAYYPRAQHPIYLYNLVVRYSGDPKAIIPAIRATIHSVDPNLPVSDIRPLSGEINGSVSNQRLVAQLSAVFGVLAAFLSCVGIYGVVSFGVTRRTNELGVRMALGAKRANVLWMVIGEASRLVLLGAAVGLVCAVACGRLAQVRSQLFGLASYDPLSIAVAVAAMAAVALFAAYLPARRATRIDPMVALRYE